jgi:hypothetical protein
MIWLGLVSLMLASGGTVSVHPPVARVLAKTRLRFAELLIRVLLLLSPAVILQASVKVRVAGLPLLVVTAEAGAVEKAMMASSRPKVLDRDLEAKQLDLDFFMESRGGSWIFGCNGFQPRCALKTVFPAPGLANFTVAQKRELASRIK